MSTQIDMIMDTDALEETGPFYSRQTTEVLPGGSYTRKMDTGQYGVTESGDSPHGGITYIDQAVGGHVEILDQVMANYGIGTFSHRQKIQPFQGDYLAAPMPLELEQRGYVGAQRQARGAQRAAMPDTTPLPDRGDVVAAFANPALSELLNRMRGR